METDPRPLHQRDPLERFSDRAADYVRFRPTYPAAAIDAILARLPDPRTLTAADIGAGTGISTRLLAHRGLQVFAIEPNAAMRDAADPHPQVTWIAASAEATTLSERSVDLIVCAQAFHWFRHDEALAEFHRVLAPGGRLALIWNDDDRDDPVTNAYRHAVTRAAARDWTGKNPFTPERLGDSGLFSPPRMQHFLHSQPLDLAGFIGRACSASYVPRHGELYDRMIEDLTAVHAKHADAAGHVALGYRTDLYLSEAARLSSRA